MSDDWNNPQMEKVASAALEQIDAAEISARLHARGRVDLRECDVKTIARLVSLSALRAPGTVVTVAGISAHVEAGKLAVFLSEEVANVPAAA